MFYDTSVGHFSCSINPNEKAITFFNPKVVYRATLPLFDFELWDYILYNSQKMMPYTFCQLIDISKILATLYFRPTGIKHYDAVIMHARLVVSMYEPVIMSYYHLIMILTRLFSRSQNRSIKFHNRNTLFDSAILACI